MLGQMESAMAFVEGQDEETIGNIKHAWELARQSCIKLFKDDIDFIIEYNPANWHASRQPAGLRRVSFMGTPYLIFEFATPNKALPFDSFASQDAKQGVIAHEISHVIDDKKWNFSFKELILESRSFITREQRAELLAFASNPIAIYEANKALISSTARVTGVNLKDIEVFAAVETLGRVGLERRDDLPYLFSVMQEDAEVHRILEEYLSSNVFSFAGLVTPPRLNNSKEYGIKRPSQLYHARKVIIEYLKNKDRAMLNQKLEALGYKVKEVKHDPFQSVDLNSLNPALCRKNLEDALDYFNRPSRWKCFEDLCNAVRQILESFQA